MTNGHVEGLLQVENERQDGQLRDPHFPLRPAKGNLIVPRSLIREMRLRPGLLLRGQPRGRTLGRIEAIEGARRTNTATPSRSMTPPRSTPSRCSSSSTTPPS